MVREGEEQKATSERTSDGFSNRFGFERRSGISKCIALNNHYAEVYQNHCASQRLIVTLTSCNDPITTQRAPSRGAPKTAPISITSSPTALKIESL